MEDKLHVVCPACGAVNRVPAARLDQGPRCGRCKTPLFQGRPVALDAAGLERHLHRDEIPLLVDFWAPWCGPCRMMAPAYEQAAALLEPRVRVAKVNTEEEQEAAARFGIRSIPTLVLFHRGREVARQAGALTSPQAIAAWVQRALGAA
ncbi:MAG: thioredoxin TrxC [Gammaproteobacteria bacterium]|nr:MAG: thioredoxin TrxC [Gammaproteobacteria bacterium]